MHTNSDIANTRFRISRLSTALFGLAADPMAAEEPRSFMFGQALPDSHASFIKNCFIALIVLCQALKFMEDRCRTSAAGRLQIAARAGIPPFLALQGTVAVELKRGQ